ncbi:MAG: 3'(2'),5'-bisphosphate nucleotidase CysQ [Pacificimonas sp.]
MTATRSDADLATHLATLAGELLLDIRRRSGLSGRALGDEGDARANDLIVEALRFERPDDGLLSEESADDLSRLDKRRVWIVDPLDGTREYAEGRDDFAVHIGLAVDGVASVGALGLPARGMALRSDKPPALKAIASPLRLATSRTRPAPVAEKVAAALGADLLHIGSAGMKTAAVLLGEADAYLHSGAQREWDNCAPVAVAQAAGLHCSRLDGSALTYNCCDVVVPDLLICQPECVAAVRNAI